MPDFKEQKRGFMMEPKGVYKKYTSKRGMPKYGLTDPNEAPIMKTTTHLGGTEREHIHKERPSHGNTEEAHGPMQAGQTAGQVVRRERLMTKRTKSEAKADAIEGGFPEEKANKVFAKHKKPFYKNGKYAMQKNDDKVTTIKRLPVKPIPTSSNEDVYMGKQSTNKAKMKRYREMQRHGYDGNAPI